MIILYLLRLGILLVVVGSLYHLQDVFNTFEQGNRYIGWILALTVELAYVSIVIGITEYRRQNRIPFFLTLSLVMFFVISVFCNTYYSIKVYLGKPVLVLDDLFELDPLVIITIILISSSLPFMALVLVNVYSIFAASGNNFLIIKRKRKRRFKKEENNIQEQSPPEEDKVEEEKNIQQQQQTPFIRGFFYK